MKIALACVAALGVLWANDAFEANPRKVQIFSLYPSGGTPSASVDVEVLGANLDGLTRFEPLCDDIKGDVLASGLLAAKLRLHVRANASPALCPVRVLLALNSTGRFTT